MKLHVAIGRQAGRQVEGEIFVVIFSLKVCVLYCQPGLSRFFACVFVGIQPVVSDRPTRRVSYAASVLRASPELPRFLAPQLIRAREHGVVGCGMDTKRNPRQGSDGFLRSREAKATFRWPHHPRDRSQVKLLRRHRRIPGGLVPRFQL